MPSETETLALHLVRALYEATGGRPQEWCNLEELDVATADAIEFAVARGWVVVQAGHSICLTDAGRKLVDRRQRLQLLASVLRQAGRQLLEKSVCQSRTT